MVLFKPLGKHMRSRAEKIAADIESAERQKSEGEEYRSQYEKQLNETADERRRIIEDAHKKATRDAEEYIGDAKKEAARILNEGRSEIQKEHDAMIDDLKNEVTSIAIAAASKIIEANTDNEKNRELVDNFMERTSVE
jgi:F-type H+-transporting ATPase subunit b